MNWSQYGPAVLSAFLGATLVDALFSGLFVGQSGYSSREQWREWSFSHRFLAFAVSRIWTALTCAAFLFVCGFFGLTSLQPALMLAIGTWLATVLPLLANAWLYLRLRPGVLVSQMIGWLAKLLVCAGAAYYFL
jgi:hypothetical protein